MLYVEFKGLGLYGVLAVPPISSYYLWRFQLLHYYDINFFSSTSIFDSHEGIGSTANSFGVYIIGSKNFALKKYILLI